MQFCPKGSRPVINDAGEHIGWTEPALVSSHARINPATGIAESMHVLECDNPEGCGYDTELPDGRKFHTQCEFTAQAMRENLAAATFTPVVEEQPAVSEPPTDEQPAINATPAAEKHAEVLGVDLTQVEPSGGADGTLITKSDVTSAAI